MHQANSLRGTQAIKHLTKLFKVRFLIAWYCIVFVQSCGLKLLDLLRCLVQETKSNEARLCQFAGVVPGTHGMEFMLPGKQARLGGGGNFPFCS